MSSCNEGVAVKQSVINTLLSDPTRLEILSALSMNEWTVSDLARSLRVSKQQIKKQVGVLRRAGLLCWRKAGNQVKYFVRDKEIGQISTLIFSWWSEEVLAQSAVLERI